MLESGGMRANKSNWGGFLKETGVQQGCGRKGGRRKQFKYWGWSLGLE
jgi:hypothetical protein